MSRRPPAGTKDANHDAVKAAFEALGCSVEDFYNAGKPGWPDLVVGVVGVTHLVEVKSPESRYGRAGLNKNQTAFAQAWRGGRVWVCCSTDEAAALVQNWRRS